jgi:catechol 2,3-dioxygenase-like lactoylglutathione lyase family enzyme
MNYTIKSFEPTYFTKDINSTVEFYSRFFSAKEIHKSENYLILQIGSSLFHFCAMSMDGMSGEPQNATANITVSSADDCRNFIISENSENEKTYEMTELQNDPWGMRAFNMQDPNKLSLYISHTL